MSAWGEAELLIEQLDRQFAYLGKLSGTDKIVRLARVLSFIQGEPTLTAIVSELRDEATEAVREAELADAAVRLELHRLWSVHGDAIRRGLADETDEALHVNGSFDSFENALATACHLKLSRKGDTDEEGQTSRLLGALTHWFQWTRGLAQNAGQAWSGDLAALGSELHRLSRTHSHHRGRLEHSRRAGAWFAYDRLVENARTLNPPVPGRDVPYTEWIAFEWATTLADAVGRSDKGLGANEKSSESDITRLYEELRVDAGLLHEELRLRVGLARSRRALIQRYARRCEAYDAARLREQCVADPGNAERTLTLDLARYLFDAGLDPLIDPTVSGLRPDLLHVPSFPLYVEGKQYRAKHPRAQIKKAFSQVWGTWGRLRKAYPCTEAFLVIFRRSGPWVEAPQVIRYKGLKLYSVIVDISKEGGSREKHAAIQLSEAELRPQEDDDTVDTPGRRPARKNRRRK